MKRFLTTIALASSLFLIGAVRNSASAQGFGVDISYQTFYDELSPYGRWVDFPEYGYVWAPELGPDFQPYRTGGHWVWSDDYDWMWVSDYSWGWAPFHYGRWFYDPFYGWMWVPGYDWSPGWVSWRTGGDYYGWAPLGPGISIGIGFSNYNPPYNYWSFAPRRYINSSHLNSYCVDRSRNVTIINNTTIINNYGSRKNVFVSGGPQRYEVERFTGRIRPVTFRDVKRPGEREFRNNQVRLYRPQISRQANRDIAPRTFDRYQNTRINNANRIDDRNNDQRPNVFDRGANRTDREVTRSNDEQREILERNRRNIFDRDINNRTNREVNRSNDEQREIMERNRRNIFDRDVNNRTNREVNRSSEQQEKTIDGNRRNVFDRDRNIAERNSTEQPSNDNRQRPNVFDRNANRNSQSRENEFRRLEQQRSNDQQPGGRFERREIQQRRVEPAPQNNRTEIRTENRPQREYAPQQDRQARQFQRFENRRVEQQNNGNGGRGRFERNNR